MSGVGTLVQDGGSFVCVFDGGSFVFSFGGTLVQCGGGFVCGTLYWYRGVVSRQKEH